ncbi:MAG: imidazole glycerol phosphate synthase subunit HisH [Steroidobacteraceae bacterium]
MDVAIIDSGGANLASLQFALERLGARSFVSSDPAAIAAAPRVLLPGVGAAASAMRRLQECGLDQLIPQLQVPLLGVCLGMQLLFEHSAEADTRCLGVFPGRIERLSPGPGLPVPHMGWNTLEPLAEDALLAGLGPSDYLYFVHSYAAVPDRYTLAAVHYGKPLAAIVRRGNFCGAQFHPERSAASGARMLRNFLSL